MKQRINIKQNLQPMRPNDVFFIVVPNYWGIGTTLREAKSKLRKAGGNLYGAFIVYSAHVDTYVNDRGQLAYPIGHVPMKLQENKHEYVTK